MSNNRHCTFCICKEIVDFLLCWFSFNF